MIQPRGEMVLLLATSGPRWFKKIGARAESANYKKPACLPSAALFGAWVAKDGTKGSLTKREQNSRPTRFGKAGQIPPHANRFAAGLRPEPLEARHSSKGRGFTPTVRDAATPRIGSGPVALSGHF